MENDQDLVENIARFRGQLADDLNAAITDQDCKRFIVARKNDIDKAVLMINEWWKWWNTPYPSCDGLTPATMLNVDNLEDPDIDIVNRCAPHTFHGFAKNGCPVFWEKTGEISSHLTELKERFNMDQLMGKHIRTQAIMNARCHYISKKLNKPIEQVIIVCDYQGMPMTPDFFGIEYCQKLFAMDQNYYPERLFRTYLINAPWFFSALYSLVSSWIDPVTASKIRVLGSTYTEALREDLEDWDIPVEYGGSCETFRWGWPYSEESGVSPEQLREYILAISTATPSDSSAEVVTAILRESKTIDST